MEIFHVSVFLADFGTGLIHRQQPGTGADSGARNFRCPAVAEVIPMGRMLIQNSQKTKFFVQLGNSYHNSFFLIYMQHFK